MEARAYSTASHLTYSYAEFMNISKEISTLENDLLELKENLAEWRSMPSVLHIEEAANATGESLSFMSQFLLAQL